MQLPVGHVRQLDRVSRELLARAWAAGSTHSIFRALWPFVAVSVVGHGRIVDAPAVDFSSVRTRAVFTGALEVRVGLEWGVASCFCLVFGFGSLVFLAGLMGNGTVHSKVILLEYGSGLTAATSPLTRHPAI